MSEKILIIDDMTYIRMILRKYLEKNNFTEIDEAADGLEALKKVNEFKPDIAILDLYLPKISGMNLIHLFLNIRPSIKILICSVSSDVELYEKALSKGALDWIKKPVNEKDLIRKIYELRDKEVKTDSTFVVEPPSDTGSEKINIKLDIDKSLQIITLYGSLDEKDINDVVETINGLVPYNYKNIIINFNGVTKLECGLAPLKNIKSELLNFVLLKNDSIQECIDKAGLTAKIFKTELQAIQNI